MFFIFFINILSAIPIKNETDIVDTTLNLLTSDIYIDLRYVQLHNHSSSVNKFYPPKIHRDPFGYLRLSSNEIGISHLLGDNHRKQLETTTTTNSHKTSDITIWRPNQLTDGDSRIIQSHMHSQFSLGLPQNVYANWWGRWIIGDGAFELTSDAPSYLRFNSPLIIHEMLISVRNNVIILMREHGNLVWVSKVISSGSQYKWIKVDALFYGTHNHSPLAPVDEICIISTKPDSFLLHELQVSPDNSQKESMLLLTHANNSQNFVLNLQSTLDVKTALHHQLVIPLSPKYEFRKSPEMPDKYSILFVLLTQGYNSDKPYFNYIEHFLSQIGENQHLTGISKEVVNKLNDYGYHERLRLDLIVSALFQNIALQSDL